MPRITVDLDDETAELLTELAENEYDGDREDAIRALLDDWLESQTSRR